MNNRNYRLDIYINEAGNVVDASNPIAVSTKGVKQAPISTSNGQTPSRTKMSRGIYTSYAIITPILNGALQSIQNQVDTTMSNSELSHRVSLGIGAISKIESAVGRVASGSAIASAFGLSASLGGGIGLAVFGIETAVNIALKAQQIELHRQVENERNNILIGRMGTQYNGSRGVK